MSPTHSQLHSTNLHRPKLIRPPTRLKLQKPREKCSSDPNRNPPSKHLAIEETIDQHSKYIFWTCLPNPIKRIDLPIYPRLTTPPKTPIRSWPERPLVHPATYNLVTIQSAQRLYVHPIHRLHVHPIRIITLFTSAINSSQRR